MRVVLDTNVLVSGLLRPDGVPGQLVDYLFSRAFLILYDWRILGEYREVLARPHLDISQDDAAAVCAFVEAHGVAVQPCPLSIALPDPDDLPLRRGGDRGRRRCDRDRERGALPGRAAAGPGPVAPGVPQRPGRGLRGRDRGFGKSLRMAGPREVLLDGVLYRNFVK